jgi:hypothetical protein
MYGVAAWLLTLATLNGFLWGNPGINITWTYFVGGTEAFCGLGFIVFGTPPPLFPTQPFYLGWGK